MTLTFAMIKPDAVQDRHVGQIIDLIEKNGFEIVGMQKGMFDKKIAQEFYVEHKGKPFFNDLVNFIVSGPVVAMALMKDDAVNEWRKLIGATNPAQAAEGTIRKMFAKSIDQNAVHGSDSAVSAERELEMFFPGITQLLKDNE